jgi:hypothetical protein
MTPRNFGYAAIALALISMPILTGCGQGAAPMPVPPTAGGGIGLGGCFPLTGAGTVPTQGSFPSAGSLNVPINFTGAQFTPHNRRITAGRIPMGTVPTSGFPTGGTGAGQVILGGAGVAPAPIAGSFHTQQWVGMDYRYGGIQITFQPMMAPQPTMDPMFGTNPYLDMYGLPTQPSQVNGQGVVQLNAIAIQDIQQLVMLTQYGNLGPYSQPGFWPNQPSFQPIAPQAPIAPQSVCISEIAFSANIAVGRMPSLWLGDVWIYVNMTGAATATTTGPRGIRMMLN